MKIEDLRQGQLVWPTVMLGDEETDDEIAAIERLPLDSLDKPATVIATRDGLRIVDAGNMPCNVPGSVAAMQSVACDTDADGYHLTLAEAIDAGAKLCEESAAIETKRAAAMRRLAHRARRQQDEDDIAAVRASGASDTIRTVPREPGDPEWAKWVGIDTPQDDSIHKLWVFEREPIRGYEGWWTKEGNRDATTKDHGLQPGEKARLAPIK